MRANWIVVLGLVAAACSGAACADPFDGIEREWRLLREELRGRGLHVSSYVETPEQIAADMARIRRELERRSGRPVVSSLQRVGGGAPSQRGDVAAGERRTGGIWTSGLRPTPRLSR